MIDTTTLKQRVSIERIANKLGVPLHGDCITGHDSQDHNCFHVDVKNGLFNCFHCGTGGDGIKLVMLSRGCSFPEAITWITESFELQNFFSLSREKYTARRTQTERPKPEPVESYPALTRPSEAWINKSNWLQKQSAAILFSPAGKGHLDYLTGRKITPEMAKKFGIGSIPSNQYFDREMFGLPPKTKADGSPKNLVIPRGIIIPVWRKICNQWVIAKFKIRRTDPSDIEKYHNKYLPIKPDIPMASMVFDVKPELPTITVESELDAIILAHVAGDLINAVGLGSATARPDAEVFSFIQQSPVALVAMDVDSAGKKAAWDGWLAELPNKYRLVTPTRPDGQRFKDPGEYYQAGGDLRLWVKVGLKLAAKKLNTATDTPKEVIPQQKTVKADTEPVTPEDQASRMRGTIEPEPVDAEFFADATVERYGYLDGRGVVVSPEPLSEKMTVDDWKRYEALKDKHYASLPDDIRRKMHHEPGTFPAHPAPKMTATVVGAKASIYVHMPTARHFVKADSRDWIIDGVRYFKLTAERFLDQLLTTADRPTTSPEYRQRVREIEAWWDLNMDEVRK
ncbi:MAG: hypothetical protein HQK56_09670 [Deltaproteobacteria bacterium]|nr:hypothetical protein [Deltaproteobacteria bacterium]